MRIRWERFDQTALSVANPDRPHGLLDERFDLMRRDDDSRIVGKKTIHPNEDLLPNGPIHAFQRFIQDHDPWRAHPCGGENRSPPLTH